MILRASVIGLLIIFGASGLVVASQMADPADRFRDLIPSGVQVEKSVYHHTQWFGCFAEVYKLTAPFADDLRRRGVVGLGSGGWKPTPVVGPYDMTINARNAANTDECLSKEYQTIFDRYVYKAAGYYAMDTDGGFIVVAPQERLLFISDND